MTGLAKLIPTHPSRPWSVDRLQEEDYDPDERNWQQGDGGAPASSALAALINRKKRQKRAQAQRGKHTGREYQPKKVSRVYLYCLIWFVCVFFLGGVHIAIGHVAVGHVAITPWRSTDTFPFPRKRPDRAPAETWRTRRWNRTRTRRLRAS